MKKLIILGLIGICGTGYSIYYKIPYFARPAALGEAMVSMQDNAYNMFYNPASIYNNSISFSLTEWFIDTRAGSCAGTYKVKDYFTVGSALSYFTYGQMQYFNENGEAGDYFSAGLWQYRLSVAKEFYKYFTLGIGSKVLHQSMDTITETKLMSDLGLIFTSKYINIGASVHDLLVSDYKMTTDIGVSAKPINNLLILAAVNYEEKVSMRAGIEYNFKPVFFRVGYADKNLSAGIGYEQKEFVFDYAFVNHKDLGLTHQFTITIK
jgi:hypothetical protein